MKKKLKYNRNIHVLFTEKQYAFLRTLDLGIGEYLRGLVDEQIQQAAEKKREEQRMTAERERLAQEQREREEAQQPPARALTDQEMQRIRELREKAYISGLMKPEWMEPRRKRKMKR